MKRLILISTLLLHLCAWQSAYSQERPQWTYGFREERANSYIEMVSDQDWDLASARNRAIRQVIVRRGLAVGADTKVSIQDGDVYVDGQKDLIIKMRIIDEWHEQINGRYTIYLLVQTAQNPALKYEPVSISDRYPFSARVFVPGMAQIYKGSTAKGVCFIAGEAILLGGIVTSECLRAQYVSQMNSTHNSTLKKRYANYANSCNIARNVCICGAVAVYAWNVIDGIVAKGKKKVIIGTAQLQINPYVGLDNGGLALNINF